MKSRVLMSLVDDEPGGAAGDTADGQRRTTFCLRDIWARWWRVVEPASDDGGDSDGSATVNQTASDEQALMHPDMAVMTVARLVNATQ